MRKLLLALVFCLAPGLVGAQPVITATQASIPITVSTQTTAQLVPAISGKSIYVTSAMVIAAGTTNVTFVYGTGTNCGTGQGNVTGTLQLTAQVGFAYGDGSGIIWVVPQGNALCVTNSQAIAIPGSLSYAQF